MSKWYRIYLDPAFHTREVFYLEKFQATDRVKGRYRTSRGRDGFDCIILKFKNKNDAMKFKLETGIGAITPHPTVASIPRDT